MPSRSGTAPAAPAGRPSMFRAMREPNFRKWLIGALVTSIGSWAHRTAQDWVVLTELTDHDAVAVGISLSLQFGPIFILGPFVGTLVDRFNGRKILIFTTAAEGVLALILGLTVLTGVASLPLLYALALGLGIVQSLEAPARQTFVGELVGTSLLPNAVALNSTMFNSSRLIGPAIAGVLITTAGTGWVLTLASAGYFGGIIAMLSMRQNLFHPMKKIATTKGGFAAGLRYIGTRGDLKVLLVMVFIVGALVFNYSIFGSTMAVIEFGLGAHDYGFITSALALGSIVGSLMVARSARPRLTVIILGATGVGIAAVLSAVAPSITAFMFVYPLLGLASITMVATTNAYLQTTTEPEFRGRVMAMYTTVLIGGTPFGSPLVGWLANEFGPRWAVSAAAVGGFSAALIAYVWIRRTHHLKLTPAIRSSFSRERDEFDPESSETQMITLTERGPQ